MLTCNGEHILASGRQLCRLQRYYQQRQQIGIVGRVLGIINPERYERRFHSKRNLSYKSNINDDQQLYFQRTMAHHINSMNTKSTKINYTIMATNSSKIGGNNKIRRSMSNISLSSMNHFEDDSIPVQKDDDLLIVSILGPPNAGKSTLFNRLMCKETNRTYRLASEKNPYYKSHSTARMGMAGAGGKRRKKLVKKSSVHGGSGGKAIVTSIPGTTRDRRECIGRIGSIKFRLIDTAGVDGDRIFVSQKSKKKVFQNYTINKQLQHAAMEQTITAAKSSDLIFLMFDAKIGMTADFHETAKWIRKLDRKGEKLENIKSSSSLESLSDVNKEIHQHDIAGGSDKNKMNSISLLANKLEGDSWTYDESPTLDHLYEATRIGFGEAIPISAQQGDGIGDIAEIIYKLTEEKKKRNKKSANHNKEAEDQPQQQKKQSNAETIAMQENNTDVKSEQGTNTKESKKTLQLAILGRPNVGKSTLVNALIKQERVITGPAPGITRDSILIEWYYSDDQKVHIIDTAGIRKISQRSNNDNFINHADSASTNSSLLVASKSSTSGDSKIHYNNNDALIEDMAVLDAMRAMKIADVAILVIDATTLCIQRQELAIAKAILKEGRALVIVVTKIDLIIDDDNTKSDAKRLQKEKRPIDDFPDDQEEEEKEYSKEQLTVDVQSQIEARFPMLRKTPIITVSSITGNGLEDIMPTVLKTRERWEREIPTGVLNRWLKEVTTDIGSTPQPVLSTNNNGARQNSKRYNTSSKMITPKIKYIIQTRNRPPRFLLFCNNISRLPESFSRYLIRNFQDTFQMYGMEVRFAIKASATNNENPFVNKNAKNSSRSGSGLGGRDGRKKRLVQQLKQNGKQSQRRKRKRKN